jgi:hypothetical protein
MDVLNQVFPAANFKSDPDYSVLNMKSLLFFFANLLRFLHVSWRYPYPRLKTTNLEHVGSSMSHNRMSLDDQLQE